jgi:hypothetical protein
VEGPLSNRATPEQLARMKESVKKNAAEQRRLVAALGIFRSFPLMAMGGYRRG